MRENSRNITLSEAGTVYFNFFQRMHAELHNIRKILSGTTTVLRLGYNIGWNMSSFLPKVVDVCRKDNPEFKISFECLGFRDLIQALDDKHLDAIITTDDYVEGKSRMTSLSQTQNSAGLMLSQSGAYFFQFIPEV